jgi:hypothetical protein
MSYVLVLSVFLPGPPNANCCMCAVSTTAISVTPLHGPVLHLAAGSGYAAQKPLQRPERCCQLPEPRRAAPQNKGQFHVILLEKMVSLDATWSAWMPQQPVQPDGTM